MRKTSARLLRLVSPGGIDTSSGVESAPGVKDVALIEAFFRAVRAAGEEKRGLRPGLRACCLPAA